jgi:hypothetical protein
VTTSEQFWPDLASFDAPVWKSGHAAFRLVIDEFGNVQSVETLASDMPAHVFVKRLAEIRFFAAVYRGQNVASELILGLSINGGARMLGSSAEVADRAALVETERCARWRRQAMGPLQR